MLYVLSQCTESAYIPATGTTLVKKKTIANNELAIISLCLSQLS